MMNKKKEFKVIENSTKKRKIEKLTIEKLSDLILTQEEKELFWYKMYQLILFTIPSQMSHLNICKMSINQKKKETDGLYKVDKDYSDDHTEYEDDIQGSNLTTKLFYFFKWKQQPYDFLHCNRNVHKLAFILSLFDKNGLILKPLGTTDESGVIKPIKELTKEKVRLIDAYSNEKDIDLDKVIEDNEEDIEEDNEEESNKDEDEQEEEKEDDEDDENITKEKKKRKDYYSLNEGKAFRRLKPLIECSHVMVGYSHDYDLIPLSRFCYFILCGKENELFKRIDPIYEQFDTNFEEYAFQRDKLKSVAVSPFIEGPFQPFCYYLYLDKKVNYNYHNESYGADEEEDDDQQKVVENGTPVVRKKKKDDKVGVINGYKWITDKLGCTPGFWNASFTWFPLLSVKTKFEKNIIKVTQNEFGTAVF
ncbi:hypothetical protein ABK040_016457 [Willaertia magna]